jgi:hypothetical protein
VAPFPVSLLNAWREERNLWLAAHPKPWSPETETTYHKLDRLIRDWDHFINVARYIRRNPVKAKLPDGRFLNYEAQWVQRLLS